MPNTPHQRLPQPKQADPPRSQDGRKEVRDQTVPCDSLIPVRWVPDVERGYQAWRVVSYGNIVGEGAAFLENSGQTNGCKIVSLTVTKALHHNAAAGDYPHLNVAVGLKRGTRKVTRTAHVYINSLARPQTFVMATFGLLSENIAHIRAKYDSMFLTMQYDPLRPGWSRLVYTTSDTTTNPR
ncbi:Protein of unknown function [Pyronema omphalodes CBS 100304]|uniref:Uncharacterized protein n=1 Tax=Pyronema omphalodes (strain CBS 100304) TaxID=1076935 RepID=U4LPC9_PYROM|nr:Protein of unknown function [Pyronema omphalodes CBS 100304]